jgi:Cu+-exporting ATPase
MHPEVIEDRPIPCRICGMALEPMGPPSANQEPSAELQDFMGRLKLAALFTLPLLLLSMSPHLGVDLPGILGSRLSQLLELSLALPVSLWIGWPIFERGIASLKGRHPNMWTLLSLGIGSALVYSAVAVLLPTSFPAGLMRPDGTVGVYFEAAAVIVFLVLLGQVLELKARERTGDAIRSLLNLAPKMARLVAPGGEFIDTPIEHVQVGDHLSVRPGEAVPTDGSVVEGRSNVDEKLITGEPVPVVKGPGDAVTGGTINLNGTFIMRAEKVGSDTMLSRIVTLVASAQRSRAPIQNRADAISAWFVPAVVAVSLLSFLAWIAFGPEPRLAYAVVAAISVLIIACPCALGLATPMSIMVATGRGAREGVLVRNAEALERLASADTIVIDKTGTLTEGRPRLTDVVPLAELGANEVLSLAASLEAGSEHPLAGAIVAAAQEKKLNIPRTETFLAVPGSGVVGKIAGQDALIGNARFLTDYAIPLNGADQKARELAARGRTALILASSGKVVGLLGVADPVKAEARTSLERLRSQGLEIVMATGDAIETAQAVAHELAITAVHAGMLPQAKGTLVAQLKSQGRKVVFAGDGINDAPALAAADTGIAMGTGADVAIESAGITLPRGDLKALVRAHDLARATVTNIKQNLALAFGYNALAIPVAAGLLYPVFGVLLSPVFAAAAMSLSSVSVIANALRLNRASSAAPSL